MNQCNLHLRNIKLDLGAQIAIGIAITVVRNVMLT